MVLAFKCPRCGEILKIIREEVIDAKTREVHLVCDNCGLEFKLLLETTSHDSSDLKKSKSYSIFKLPENAPEPIKIFSEIYNNAPYKPFYLKILSSKKPEGGIEVSDLGELGIPESVSKKLENHFREKGISRLFKFQEEAIRNILLRKNVLITAPTGTGKTESFAIPSFTLALEETTKGSQPPIVLIIYPTKALARDQRDKLIELAKIFDLDVDVLDGDTSHYKRRKILASPPDVLITNFDMINYHLANRTKLSHLFTRARIVIMDEAHEYSGAFGTHVYYILKRLRRLNRNEKFQIVMSSATIHNAEEFARLFIGNEFVIVKEERRKTPLYILFTYPFDTPFRIIAQMVSKSIKENIKTLAFLNTRKNAELTLYVLNRLAKRDPAIRGLYDIHRGGLPKKIREKIEKEFKTNKKLALISTPTLELGIDIGDLDLVISEITPVDNFIQRSGRAGRKNNPGSSILVLRIEDPISEYYAKNPEDYFRDISLKYIEPKNEYILKQHLFIAAFEKPLDLKELDEFNPPSNVLKEFFDKGSFVKINDKIYANKLHFNKYFPKNIRGSDKIISVIFEGEKIDEREAIIAIRELHPGAIYVNRGKKYVSTELNLKENIAIVEEADPKYEYLYTKPLYSYSALPIEIHEEKHILGTKVFYGLLELKAIVTGYLVFREGETKPLREEELEKPITYTYKTFGIFFKAPELDLRDDEKIAGSYHATEHILIEGTNSITGGGSEDLGGISFGTSGIIVIYDGTPGGNGVSKLLFDRFEKAVQRSRDILVACKETYKESFNKCVYSYRCGNNNQPLHAEGALLALEFMLKEKEVKESEKAAKILSLLDRGYV